MQHNADYAGLDPALVRLAPVGPELTNGLSNHGPMVAEAMCALGCSARVATWVDRYLPYGQPWPANRAPVAANDATALGHVNRARDWRDYFASEIRAKGWQVSLQEAVPWLAPGTSADATHGVIRVGHAVRALTHTETNARRNELAAALAAWAAGFSRLGGEPSRAAGNTIDAAVAAIPLLPPDQRRFRGTITSALAPLMHYRPFAQVLDALPPDPDPVALATAFAKVYLAHAHDVLTTIVFIHGVTSITAIGHVLPHLEPAAASRLLQFGWQSSAALLAAFGAPRVPAAPSIAEADLDLDQLIRTAIAHGDEHAIKFTEACIYNFTHNGAAVFLAAADHALRTLPPIEAPIEDTH
jgi:hypothetical protein